MNSSETQKIISFRGEDISGRRVDQYLTEKLPEFSRSLIQKWIKDGAVLVNGVSVKQNHKIRLGDQVEVKIPPPAPAIPEPQNIPLNILFEDEHLIILNKQHGIVVHPAPGNPDRTLVNALLFHTSGLSGIGGVIRPGIVHRLDKDTSGLMLIAKTDTAHKILSANIANRSVKRIYRAIIWGTFKEKHGSIEIPIGRSSHNKLKWAVNWKDGKIARTHFKSLEIFTHFSLVELSLDTGRTHQIRIHLSYIGNPVVGDPVYSKRSAQERLGLIENESPKIFPVLQSINRQLLHAVELHFNHPITEEPMDFKSEPPDDFRTFLQVLRNEDQVK